MNSLAFLDAIRDAEKDGYNGFAAALRYELAKYLGNTVPRPFTTIRSNQPQNPNN